MKKQYRTLDAVLHSYLVTDGTASDSWAKEVPLVDYKTGAREVQALVGGWVDRDQIILILKPYKNQTK